MYYFASMLGLSSLGTNSHPFLLLVQARRHNTPYCPLNGVAALQKSPTYCKQASQLHIKEGISDPQRRLVIFVS